MKTSCGTPLLILALIYSLSLGIESSPYYQGNVPGYGDPYASYLNDAYSASDPYMQNPAAPYLPPYDPQGLVQTCQNVLGSPFGNEGFNLRNLDSRNFGASTNCGNRDEYLNLMRVCSVLASSNRDSHITDNVVLTVEQGYNNLINLRFVCITPQDKFARSQISMSFGRNSIVGENIELLFKDPGGGSRAQKVKIVDFLETLHSLIDLNQNVASTNTFVYSIALKPKNIKEQLDDRTGRGEKDPFGLVNFSHRILITPRGVYFREHVKVVFPNHSNKILVVVDNNSEHENMWKVYMVRIYDSVFKEITKLPINEIIVYYEDDMVKSLVKRLLTWDQEFHTSKLYKDSLVLERYSTQENNQRKFCVYKPKKHDELNPDDEIRITSILRPSNGEFMVLQFVYELVHDDYNLNHEKIKLGFPASELLTLLHKKGFLDLYNK